MCHLSRTQRNRLDYGEDTARQALTLTDERDLEEELHGLSDDELCAIIAQGATGGARDVMPVGRLAIVPRVTRSGPGG